MKYLFLSILALSFVLTQSVYGQIEEGTLDFRTVFTGEQVDTSFTTFAFSKDHFRTENRAQNVVSVALIEKVSEQVLILISSPNGNQAFHANLTFIEENEPPPTNYEKFIETKKKKKILGFRCQLLIGIDVFGNENHFWYTDEIKFGVKVFGVPKEVPGVALDYTINTYTGAHHYEALNYTGGAPDPLIFRPIVPPGYTFQDLVPQPTEQDSQESIVPQRQNIPAASEARYPSGQIGLRDYINSTMRYPKECMEKGETGLVSVEVVIAADGTPESHSIVLNTGEPKAMRDEALRIVKSIPRWVPAINENGQSIRSRKIVTVPFKLYRR